MNYNPGNLTQASIGDFIRQTIASMGVDAVNITNESNLDDLGLDSLDVVELIRSVRKQLQIQVAPNDFENVQTIEQAVMLITRKAGIV